MKHSIIQSFNYSIIQLFIIANCIGCVTEYIPPDIEEITDILVVEGIITDDESVITLSRSVNLMEGGYWDPIYVNNANVYIECDDGTQWYEEPQIHLSSWDRKGRYIIKTGQLNLERKYSLKIEIDEIDNSKDCTVGVWGGIICPTKTYKYVSDFSHPIKTPEIDSIFWIKIGQGRPVMIHVATHSPENAVMYYRWSFKEDWEYHSEIHASGHPIICWSTANNRDILLGSAEKTVFGQITDKILDIPPSEERLSVLYRITVKQNAISKRAHDYFTNIKKNAENMGSIFAPTPSELRGNITCVTDPSRPVIGYIDVSSTTQKKRYISGKDVYEKPYGGCEPVENPPSPLPSYLVETRTGIYYIDCVNCSYKGGTPIKPNDWLQ